MLNVVFCDAKQVKEIHTIKSNIKKYCTLDHDIVQSTHKYLQLQSEEVYLEESPQNWSTELFQV